MSISLDEKMRYLREIENIHRLSKKVLPPQGTTWAQIADKHLQKALGLPVKEQRWMCDQTGTCTSTVLGPPGSLRELFAAV